MVDAHLLVYKTKRTSREHFCVIGFEIIVLVSFF